MDLETKIALLKQIYTRHDEFFAGRKVACRKFCAACCTCNVTMTTLEGYLIVSSLGQAERKQHQPSVQQTLAGRRFQPQVTINAMAALCVAGQAVPEETSDPRWGRCPFLKQAACTIYHVRPFGCRAMMSKHDCAQTGYAAMDDFTLTVNNVFLQTIEHLHHDGLSGNLSDIIQFIISTDKAETGCGDNLKSPANGLIRNQVLKTLMIPPEHRVQAQPLLRSLGLLFK